MTNKEAIEVIDRLFIDSTNENYPFTEEFGTACKLAIKALRNSVILPCKIGDTVYSNNRSQGYYMREKDAPYAYTVCFIGINGNEDFGGGFVNVLHKNGSMLQFNFRDFGSLVWMPLPELHKGEELKKNK